MSIPPAPTGIVGGTRFAVTAGNPSPDEVVAIVLALDAATRADADVAVPARPAWRAAARQEGVGGPAAASPADLRGWGR